MTLKKKIYIFVIVLLGLTTLLIAFIISPLFLEIKEASQEFLSQKQRLAELEKEFENLRSFKKILPEISPNLEKVDYLFIDDPSVPVDFIGFLEETVDDFGLYHEKSFDKPAKNEEDPWPSVSFNILLVGPFSKVCNFLEKLQLGPYLIEVQEFNLTGLTEAELISPSFRRFSSGDVKTNLLIKVYTK